MTSILTILIVILAILKILPVYYASKDLILDNAISAIALFCRTKQHGRHVRKDMSPWSRVHFQYLATYLKRVRTRFKFIFLILNFNIILHQPFVTRGDRWCRPHAGPRIGVPIMRRTFSQKKQGTVRVVWWSRVDNKNAVNNNWISSNTKTRIMATCVVWHRIA